MCAGSHLDTIEKESVWNALGGIHPIAVNYTRGSSAAKKKGWGNPQPFFISVGVTYLTKILAERAAPGTATRMI